MRHARRLVKPYQKKEPAMTDLSPQTLQELRMHIDASLAESAFMGPVEAAALPVEFCKIWPNAKPLLDALSGIAVLVPGYGSAAAASLRALIAVGEAIRKEAC
jgi:hypothetical protein